MSLVRLLLYENRAAPGRVFFSKTFPAVKRRGGGQFWRDRKNQFPQSK
jgi:hypothetical protein